MTSGSGCQSFAAARWLSNRPRPGTVLTGPVLVEARAAGEARGFGLFAVRHISRFSQILVDPPLMTMKPGDDLPELYLYFKRLSKVDQEHYLALSRKEDPGRDTLLKDKLLQRGFDRSELQRMANIAGIMQTNAFNVDVGDGLGSNHRALFPKIARINHSCAPNAHVCYVPPANVRLRGFMVVHALKDILPGDEILISYFNIVLPKLERQAKARKWGFVCDCPLCTGVEDTEELRAAVRNFTAQQTSVVQSVRVALEVITELIAEGESLAAQIIHRSELFPTLPELLNGLGTLRVRALAVQKLEAERTQALDAFEQSLLWEARITGVGSAATAKRLKTLRTLAAQQDSSTTPHILSSSGDYSVEWTSK